MRRMKIIALALSAASVPALSGTAHAQGIPVIDTSSIVQQIEQVRQGVQMIQKANEQLNEAKQLYTDLNKATDISGLANKLKSDVLRDTNVSSSNLSGFSSGDLNVVGGLRGKANETYQDLMGKLTGKETAAERTAYEQKAREAAVSAGLASNVGDSVTGRREGLEELRNRLAGATSAAERSDMSARLQLEQAQMMNDQMGLQAIELQRRAKSESDDQKAAASQRANNAQFQSQWGVQ